MRRHSTGVVAEITKAERYSVWLINLNELISFCVWVYLCLGSYNTKLFEGLIMVLINVTTP